MDAALAAREIGFAIGCAIELHGQVPIHVTANTDAYASLLLGQATYVCMSRIDDPGMEHEIAICASWGNARVLHDPAQAEPLRIVVGVAPAPEPEMLFEDFLTKPDYPV